MAANLFREEQGEEQERNELQQKVDLLQRDWEAYKQSTTAHHCRSRPFSAVMQEALALLNNSPKRLLYSLQQEQLPSEEWISRGGSSRTVEEIVLERRVAIKSGKLKGRRLLEALESAAMEKALCSNRKEEEICSVCSSVLIHASEGKSSSSSSSSCSCCTLSLEDCGVTYGCCGYYSSSSCFSLEDLEGEKNKEEKKKKKIVMGGKRSGGGFRDDEERWMVRMTWVAIVLIVIAFGIISFMGFYVEEGEYLIPT